MKRRPIAISAALCILWAHTTTRAAELPSEFETLSSKSDRLFSLGGVLSLTLTQSSVPVFSGSSMQIYIGFAPTFFSWSIVSIGSTGIAAPALHVAPNADTFSIAIQSPTNGQLSLRITIREDDKSDGVIDLTNGDEECESPVIMLEPGTNIYNIPSTSFVNTNMGLGNGQRDFTTTPMMAFFLTFETNAAFPGGQIAIPTSLIIDHVGFYFGIQVSPCPGDADASRAVDFNDITSILSNWLTNFTPTTGPGDANGDGIVNFADITSVLGNWLVEYTAAPAATGPGDADESGIVNFADITSILGNWLIDYRPTTGLGDANGDGIVNFDDITAALSNWLAVCP